MEDELNRRCAEVLEWKWNRNCVIAKGGTPIRICAYRKCWAMHEDYFNPCEDARQWSVLLEMMPYSAMSHTHEAWNCVRSQFSGTDEIQHGDKPGIAVVRAFLAWLEPMTPEERNKVLGR